MLLPTGGTVTALHVSLADAFNIPVEAFAFVNGKIIGEQYCLRERDVVRDWAVAHGDDPKLRIALCGYEGEYRMPPNWSVFRWKNTGNKNGHRERIWFSPHCLP